MGSPLGVLTLGLPFLAFLANLTVVYIASFLQAMVAGCGHFQITQNSLAWFSAPSVK